MSKTFAALACLVCVCHGRRVQVPEEQEALSQIEDATVLAAELDALETFAALLLAVSPAGVQEMRSVAGPSRAGSVEMYTPKQIRRYKRDQALLAEGEEIPLKRKEVVRKIKRATDPEELQAPEIVKFLETAGSSMGPKMKKRIRNQVYKLSKKETNLPLTWAFQANFRNDNALKEAAEADEKSLEAITKAIDDAKQAGYTQENSEALKAAWEARKVLEDEAIEAAEAARKEAEAKAKEEAEAKAAAEAEAKAKAEEEAKAAAEAEAGEAEAEGEPEAAAEGE